MPTGDDLLAYINESRAAHAVAENRRRNPVDCPKHHWPLQSLGQGQYHCQYGGHVVIAPTRDN